MADPGRRAGDPDMKDPAHGERRKQCRQMHIDRRKSDIDVLEHLSGGLHVERIHATSHDRAARRRTRKKGD
jgi:hypothetical protein